MLENICTNYYNPQKSYRFGQGFVTEISVSFARGRRKEKMILKEHFYVSFSY